MKFPFIVLAITCIPFIMNGQDCSIYYSFNPMETEGYTMSCGEITENSIKVSQNSCNFYTPLTPAGTFLEGDSALLTYSIRIESNEFVDENDFILIFLYVNGQTAKSKTIYGNSTNSDIEYSEQLMIPSGGSFRSRIAFISDESHEYWELKKGNLTICIKDPTEKTVPVEPFYNNPLSYTKERGFVRLKWKTAASASANYFKIERSTDGKQYQFAGFVKENSSTGATTYSFIDSRPDKPKAWYRVIQVNNAGAENIIGEPVVVYN